MFSDMWSHRFIDFLLARETFKNKPVNSSDTTNYRQTGQSETQTTWQAGSLVKGSPGHPSHNYLGETSRKQILACFQGCMESSNFLRV